MKQEDTKKKTEGARPKESYEQDANYPSFSTVSCNRRGFLGYILAGMALTACDRKKSSRKTKRKMPHEVHMDLGLVEPFSNCPWALASVILKTKDKVFAQELKTKEAKKQLMETLSVSFQTASCTTLAQPDTRMALQQKVGQLLAATYRKKLKRSISPPRVIFVMKRSHGNGPTPTHDENKKGMAPEERPRDSRKPPIEKKPDRVKTGGIAPPPQKPNIRPGDGSRRVRTGGRPASPHLPHR